MSTDGASPIGQDRWTDDKDRQVREAIYEAVAVEFPATVRRCSTGSSRSGSSTEAVRKSV
jgi:hypothetical protein